MNIKAISLTQPWATLVAIGAKKIETRGWRYLPTHRGLLAIHAAKTYPRDCRALRWQQPFCAAMRDADIKQSDELPTASVLAICRMTDSFWFTRGFDPGEPERSFGDFTPGRVGIRLELLIRLPKPIEAKGALGLWDWTVPSDLEQLLRERGLVRG